MLTGTYTPIPVNRRKMLLLAALALTLGMLLPLYSSLVSITGGKLALGTPNSLRDLPLAFEPNEGQTAPSVRFVAHAPGGTLFFAQSEVVLALQTGSVPGDEHTMGPIAARAVSSIPQSEVVRLQFVGANTSANIQADSSLPGKVNYIKGKDRSNWHTGLPTYGEITYSGLYAGVDLRYEGTGGKLKGTYTLAPGADSSAIMWRYSGASQATVDDVGNLQIVVSPQLTLTEQAPVAWQEVDGKRTEVGVKYVEHGQGAFGFALGNYDRTQPLIIDPTLTYSTYLGGFYGDSAGSIALDSQGNIYVAGSTSSSDFPTAGSPFQPVWGGQSDAFVTKLSADGSNLIYSTFLGGSGEISGGDFARFISVDAQGNAIIGGSTDADDFPTTPDAYQIIYAGTTDLFVTKLNATGSDLIFSTYYGDPGANDPGGFTVDAAGNTYLTAYTYPGRDSYATVAELNADGSQLIFERSLGGNVPGPGDENANSAGQGIAVDSAGNIYVTGYTRAANFPVTPGAYRTTIQAYEDGFLTKLAPGGQTMVYSTYIPGGVSEYPFDVAVDAAGHAFVTGSTSSADYPTTPGAFQTVKGDPNIAFVTKLAQTWSTRPSWAIPSSTLRAQTIPSQSR